MSDIFIGLSARIPILSVTQHIGVFVIPVGKSFTASRLPEAGIWKSIVKLIAQLQLPPPFYLEIMITRTSHAAVYVNAIIIHARGFAFE